MAVKWTVTRGNDLSAEKLYDLLELRSEVFCVEQNCPYQDLDRRDLQNTILHVQGYVDEALELAAVIRIMYDNKDKDLVQIGRVVVREKFRAIGLGRQLMQAALDTIKQHESEFPRKRAMLHGQSHLRKFYESFGFEVVGDEFLEDDIPHFEMVKVL